MPPITDKFEKVAKSPKELFDLYNGLADTPLTGILTRAELASMLSELLASKKEALIVHTEEKRLEGFDEITENHYCLRSQWLTKGPDRTNQLKLLSSAFREGWVEVV